MPAVPRPLPPDPIDPLALYASGIDTSDYVDRVAPLVRDLAPPRGDLLDVGAGGGQLGDALREPGRIWTAIEPSPSMAVRLRARAHPPLIEPFGWAEAPVAAAAHDTVLAANIAAPLKEAGVFLRRCREWARRSIVWVVPAQNGPRGLCLAGCLPAEWHGEDETPGIDVILAQLADRDRPHRTARTEWSFRLTVPDVPTIAAYLADRLGWDPGDPRRPALIEHLRAGAIPVPGGYRLTVPRASAVLVWEIR